PRQPWRQRIQRRRRWNAGFRHGKRWDAAGRQLASRERRSSQAVQTRVADDEARERRSRTVKRVSAAAAAGPAAEQPLRVRILKRSRAGRAASYSLYA